MTTSGAASGYATIARDYDLHMEGSDWVRKRLWLQYDRLLDRSAHIIDIGAGTGSDSIYLAQTGKNVTAIDISEGMLTVLREKIQQNHLENRIATAVCDHLHLSDFDDSNFDGMVAGFASLNTHPDLRTFSREASRILRSGSPAIFHFLNRFTWWEWLRLVFTFQFKHARLLRERECRLVQIGDVKVRHFLHSPEDLHDLFTKEFEIIGMRGIGVVLPFAWMERLPRALRALAAMLDDVLQLILPISVRGSNFVLLSCKKK